MIPVSTGLLAEIGGFKTLSLVGIQVPVPTKEHLLSLMLYNRSEKEHSGEKKRHLVALISLEQTFSLPY